MRVKSRYIFQTVAACCSIPMSEEMTFAKKSAEGAPPIHSKPFGAPPMCYRGEGPAAAPETRVRSLGEKAAMGRRDKTLPPSDLLSSLTAMGVERCEIQVSWRTWRLSKLRRDQKTVGLGLVPKGFTILKESGESGF